MAAIPIGANHIVAVATEEGVGTGATQEGVVAIAAEDAVVAAATINRVRREITGHRVIAVAHEGIFKVAVAFASPVCEPCAHIEHIVTIPSAMVDRIDASTPIHRLRAEAREHQVIAGVAKVLAAISIRNNVVITISTENQVNTQITLEHIISVTAVNGVITSSAINSVISTATRKNIADNVSGDLIVATSADSIFD